MEQKPKPIAIALYLEEGGLQVKKLYTQEELDAFKKEEIPIDETTMKIITGENLTIHHF